MHEYTVIGIMEFGNTPYIGLGQKQNSGTYIQYRTARQNCTLNAKLNNFDARNDQDKQIYVR